MDRPTVPETSSTLPFGAYAAYYDLFYESKDYEAECRFLEDVFGRAERPVRTVLDLGCGTGGHALRLAQRGYRVTGVDRSAEMLARAQAKAPRAVDWRQGDLRALDLGRTFDAVICMFAVLGYQTTNDDLAAALRTVRRHLAPGGLFVFDCWYGPAVLAQRPETRVAELVQDGQRLLRIARPELDAFHHVVRVRYQVLRLAGDRLLDSVEEVHSMRFFFPQELAYFLAQAGLRLDNLWPAWDTTRPPTEHDWNAVGVASCA